MTQQANGVRESSQPGAAPTPRVRESVVKIPDGVVVHLRTVTQIVEAASRYSCDIRVAVGGKSASAKDVLDMLTLLGPGHRELSISADGADADAAVEALEKLVAKDLLEV